MRTRRPAGLQAPFPARAGLVGVVASALLVACAATDDVGTVAADAPLTDDSPMQTQSEDPEESDESVASPMRDMCEVIEADDIAPVLQAASGAELIIGPPTPLVAGECSFRVERTGTGADHVQVRAGDDASFAHHRSVEEVTDQSGLGDEAYSFRGVGGPELHVREGDVWIGVRFGSYDDMFGLTEESHAEVAAVVLDRVAGG